MSDDMGRDSSYVRKVQEHTRSYVEKLLRENETLRAALAGRDRQKAALEQRLQVLEEQVGRHEREHRTLRQQMAEVEADNQRFTGEYLEIEQQNANLANLYVASYRLHATLDHAEILDVIQEILINLVGSEEIAIFELDAQAEALSLSASFGIDPERYRSIPLGRGVIGRVAASGTSYIASGDDPGEEDVTACIALKVQDRLCGVVTVFGLLPQKAGLESLDRELLELLATHASVALYCSRVTAGGTGALAGVS